MHLTFIQLQFVFNIFVLSNSGWPFYTGFTVYLISIHVHVAAVAF